MTRLHQPVELGFKGTKTLRVLTLEMSPSDTDLLRTNMTDGGVVCEMVRVQTGAGYLAALENGGFDLILASYAGAFSDELSALELAREIRPELPFIVVSDRPGEELAVESMIRGATDYVLKHRLERLVPAVRRATEALREDEQQFRTLVEQIPVATYTQQTVEPGKSETRPTVYASPQIEALSGYPPRSFVEDPELWIKLLHPDDREWVLAEDRSTDESGEPFRVEYRQITRDGHLVWVRDEAVLVRDEEGQPRFWQGVMYDVTARKRAEEALERSEQRFRAIFEQTSMGIVQVALDGRLLNFNDRFCKIVGYTREEIPRVDFRDILVPEDLERDLERDARMLSGEMRHYSEEKRIRQKNGSLKWISLTISLIYSSGEPECFVGVIEDISDRKRFEEALRHSEELYRTVVEQAAENIFLVDVESKRVLEANAALARSLGYSPEELKRMSLYDIVAHDRESVDLNVERVVADGRRFIGERRYRRKDGSLVDVETSASTISYGGREMMCIVAHDVTERKLAEERFRQSLSIMLALRQAGQILGSTLSSEEIISRLLEIMRNVSHLTAAVITRADEEGTVRIWHSAGLETLWERARFAPEAQAARQAVFAGEEHRLFRLYRSDSDGASLVGLCLPLGIKEVFGVLEAYGPESLVDNDMVEILSSLSSQAASALENARLYEEVEERQREQQELVGKLLGAQEEERRRVAYEVHDELAQVAVAAHQHLQAFARRYASSVDTDTKDLERILRLVRATVSDARRIIANLRPTALDDLGLAAAVSLEVENLRGDGYHVKYIENLGDARLPDSLEIALFRIVQEALNNVRKHAEARRVRISMERRGSEVHLEVRDDGRGLDPSRAFRGSGPGERVGLAGMRERASILGGTLEINSRPGAGTSIEVTVPLTR